MRKSHQYMFIQLVAASCGMAVRGLIKPPSNWWGDYCLAVQVFFICAMVWAQRRERKQYKAGIEQVRFFEKELLRCKKEAEEAAANWDQAAEIEAKEKYLVAFKRYVQEAIKTWPEKKKELEDILK